MQFDDIPPPGTSSAFAQLQKRFIARGLAAAEEARASRVYYPREAVMDSLREILKKAERKTTPPAASRR